MSESEYCCRFHKTQARLEQAEAEIVRLRAALTNILNDAAGERRDPLWIVRRELIGAGWAALAPARQAARAKGRQR